MAGDRKRMLWVMAVLVLFAAGALALTSPRDKTTFVSVRRPAPSKVVRATDGGAARADRDTAVSAKAESTQAERASGENGSATKAAAGGERGASTEAEQETRTAESAAVRPPRGAAVKRNLFRPLVTASGLPGDLPPASLPPWPPAFDGLMPLPEPTTPMERRQRAYWEYTGTVQLNGVTYALIQEKKTNMGAYLKVGDAFRGGIVERIHPQYVVLSLAGQRYTLPKSSGLTDESVQSSAAPASAPAPASTSPAPTAPASAPTPNPSPPAVESRSETPPDMVQPTSSTEGFGAQEGQDRRSWRRRRFSE